MADPEQDERDAEKERDRAAAHEETADMLERQAQEQREDQTKEDEAHEE